MHATPQQSIQHLAFFNIPFYLSKYTSTSVVQTIVDLGVQESFKPVYDMYVGISRGISAVKRMGLDDGVVSVPNFRNLPVPTFVDSKDSRLLQFSDLLVGLLLAEAIGSLSPLKRALLRELNTLRDRVHFQTVNWKINSELVSHRS